VNHYFAWQAILFGVAYRVGNAGTLPNGPHHRVRLKGVRRLFMQIIVRDNNVDQALRALKKKLQREGVYREMKLRRHYEKPSEKRARERAAAIRRARKLERKRMEREGTAR
jgi:small subunit ribosomal protein S21